MHKPGEIRFAILANVETLNSREGPVPLFWCGFDNDKTTPVAREHTFVRTRKNAMLFYNAWTAEFFNKHWLTTVLGEPYGYVATVRLDSA